MSKFNPSTSAEKAEVEDRGSPAYIWDAPYDSSFMPMIDATCYFCISVPIGYTFVPHPVYGVVLRDTFGRLVVARYALGLALDNKQGFRVREQNNYQ